VNLSNFTGAGILVGGGGGTGGAVTIGAGVSSTASGEGLHVTGTGMALVSVPSGGAQTALNGNTHHGILVDTNAGLSLSGVPTAGSETTGPTGTIVTDGNSAAGIWVQQTPDAAANQPVTINGLVSFANSANGMRVVAGSTVTMLNTWSLGNGGDGLIISTGNGGTAAQNNDISNISLGSGSTNGNNLFQQAGTGFENSAVGICLSIASGHTAGTGGMPAAVAPQALNAVGNAFSLLNCAGQAGTLQLNPNSCASKACAGGVCDLGLAGGKVPGGTTAQPNSFDVSMCLQ